MVRESDARKILTRYCAGKAIKKMGKIIAELRKGRARTRTQLDRQGPYVVTVHQGSQDFYAIFCREIRKLFWSDPTIQPKPVAELARLGVKRVTIGANIAKAALTLVRRAADELSGPCTYSFAEGAFTQPEIHHILRGE